MSEDPRIVDLRARGSRIGAKVFFGPDVYIEHDFAPLLTIEDGAVLARGVSVLLHDSALNNVAGEPLKFGKVRIGERSYVGANTTILCGVVIGAGAVVGAASLVTRDIPPDTYAYGAPARVVGPVADLISKHRAQQASDQRFFYLPLAPWRDRQGTPADKEAGERIEALLWQAAGRTQEQREEQHDHEPGDL